MSTVTANLALLMVDDHPVVTHGIALLLEEYVRSVDSVSSGEELLAKLPISAPDVVLLDIGLPGISGLEALETLRLLGCTVPVIMLTMYDDEAMVRRALSVGASGYVVKNASGEELVTAIEYAARGEVFISSGTRRTSHFAPARNGPTQGQLAILRLVSDGLSAKQIATTLGLSRRTVESHKYMLMQQYGARTTIGLIRKAKEAGTI